MRAFRYSIIAIAALCIGLALHATGSLHVDSDTWVPAPAMNAARTGAASVLMPDGRILVTGGSDANGNPLASSEFFNSDGSFSDAPSMASARSGHSAVWLPTGYVLVAGGATTGGGATNTAELFDPISNQWTTLSSTMVEARSDFTATVLRFGNVVIAGGSHAGVPVSSVEVFDISSETFASAGALNTARANAAAVAISDNKVLVAGGSDANNVTLASTEVIDTEAGTITAGPVLSSPRRSASATVLLDGKVLIAGGSYPEGAAVNAGVAELSSTDIYDPAAGTVAAGPSMNAPRASHQAFLLPNNNNVLFVGGVSGGQDLSSAELYTPWTGSVATQPSMAAARKQATGAPMYSPAFRDGLDGVLMVAGGSNLSSAEMYGFATVKTDKDDYAPGTPVIITGSGWVPGETVTLSLLEFPNFDTHTLDPVTADANGNIYSDQFSPDVNDLNIKFYLTASGSKSTAQTAFSDSVTSVTITSVSPTTTIVALPATVTVNFNYVTSATGATTAQLDLSGTALSANKSISPGTGSDSLSITVPAGTANGSYNAKVTVSNSTGTGANNKNDTRNSAFVINVPLNVATSTVITSSSATPKYGDSVTFTATISPASGSVAPTGTVAMKVDGAAVASSISTVGNTTKASFTTTTLAAGSHTVDAAFTGTGNFGDSTATQFNQNVGKAVLTITADDKSMSFGGAVPALTYTPSGFKNGEGAGVLSGAPALSTTATSSSPVGGYPITVTVGTLTAANYTFTFVNGTLTVGQADVTIVWSNITANYDGSAHAITATPAPSGAGLIVTYTGASYNSTTAPTNAGSYTATVTLSDTTNYEFASGALTSSSFTINKVDPVMSATGGTFTYDTTAHAGSGTATGVGTDGPLTPVVLNYQDSSHNPIASAPVNAGSYFVIAHFAGNNNYNAKDSAPAAITIDKADPVMSAAGGTFTYDTTEHGGSGTATGVGSDGAQSPVTLNYQDSSHNPIASAPVNAGSYFVIAHFAGSNNYNAKDSAPAAITINKADANVTVNGYSDTYDAAAHGATGTATGVAGVDLSAGLSLGATFTDVPGGSAHWTFAGGINYNDQSGDVAIVISKANASFSVTGYSGTFDGLAHGASGSATGVGGAILSAGINFGSSFTDVPGGTAHWVFTGGTNYNNQSGDVPITITQADSTTTVTCGGPYTYNGTPQTPCSVLVTGAGGLHVTPNPTYSNNVNAGIATASYSYLGDTNHTGSTDSKNFTIEKAAVTATAGSYSAIYDAAPHAPSACLVAGSYTGDLACTNVPATVGPDVSSGAIVPSVTGTGIAENFTVTPINGSYSVTQAISITVVTCPTSVTYSGVAQTPCTASVTGVGGLNQSLTVGYSNNTNAGTATGSASFAGDLNHSGSNGSKNFTIDKAMPTISVTGYNVIFDNAAHTATGSAKGVLGEPLSGLNLSSTTHTLVGAYTDNWSFTDSTNNYLSPSGTVNDSIGKWTLAGFYQPVTTSNGVVVWNIVKGGSTVPVKFNIYAGTVQRTDVAAVVGQSIALYQVNCQTPGIDDTLDEVVNTGSTSLRFDGSGGQFIQNWQTPKGANQCFLVQMNALDGSKLQAYFRTK